MYSAMPKNVSAQSHSVSFGSEFAPEKKEKGSGSSKKVLLSIGALALAGIAAVLLRKTSAAKKVVNSVKSDVKDVVNQKPITEEILPEVQTKSKEVLDEIWPQVEKDLGKKQLQAKTEAEKAVEPLLKPSEPASPGTPEKLRESTAFNSSFAEDLDSIPSYRRGSFGQDVYDPIDPLNQRDILSPYYKDPLSDPLDPLSPLNPANNPFGSSSYGFDGGFGSGLF